MNVTSDHLQIWIVGTQPVTLSGFKLFVEKTFPGSLLKVSHGFERLNGERRSEGPVIVIYDVPLMEKSSLDAFAVELQQSGNILPIVYLDTPRIFHAMQLLNLGVKGILNKEEPLEYLQSCIISVLNGGIYFSQNLLEALLNPVINKPVNSALSLSIRQQQIINLLSKGYRTRDISKELKLYPSTISAQKRLIFDKLGLGNWDELKSYVNGQF